MVQNLETIEKLIANFQKLGGVGYKTAQRYAYKIIDMEIDDVNDFAKTILDVKNNVKYCAKCGNFTEEEICNICKNRKSSIICVVAEPKDVIAFEKVKEQDLMYHVLHGCISPLENKSPDDLNIKSLLKRVQQDDIKEVLIATNPTIEGEATAMYIAKILKPLGVKCTRLAQGISMGSDIEYADQLTLEVAINSRVEI